MKIFIKKSPINTDFRELCISQQNTKTLVIIVVRRLEKYLDFVRSLDASFFLFKIGV